MIYSYRNLKEALNALSDEQLDQQVEVLLPQFDHDKSFPLHPVLTFNTVKYLMSVDDECDMTRSSIDNEHHPDHFVLAADFNMYAEDGAIAFDLETGDSIYNKKDEFKEVFDDK